MRRSGRAANHTGQESTMRRRLALAITAALLSLPAVAAATAYDDTTYPDPAAAWAGSVRASSDIRSEQGDVAYPASHATIWKGTPPAGQDGMLASADDTAYPAADDTARPALDRAPAPARSAAGTEQRLACGCPRQ